MQQNIQVSAPGFMGLNTEQAPTNLDPGWASTADNAVMDDSGRIAARKGYRVLTSDASALGSDPLDHIHEANYADGTTVRFAVGNNKIFTFDTAGVLTDVTPAGATITADDWQIVTVNDDTLFFQRDHDPLIYDNSASTLDLATNHTDYVATVPEADCVTAAYGRAWAGGVDGERSIVYWSDLLIPAAWGGGSSGSLDITNLWPSGNDEITAIVAHNQKLIIFGKQNIVVFGSSASDGKLADPAADLFFEDGIVDIGCVGKHAWTVVGQDVWFVDYTGLRSLGRTIQEKSLPIGDISKNIDTRFRGAARTEDENTRLFYSPDDAFVLANFPNQGRIFCFDTRSRLQDGSYRATRWTGLDFYGIGRSIDGTVWFGNNDGLNRHTGYLDAAAADGTGGGAYRLRYYFHPQHFGKPAQVKVPKEVDFVIGGTNGQLAVCYWGYGYGSLFERHPFLLDAQTPDFYNVDEFNITTSDDPDDPTEYGSGSEIGEYVVHLSGSGVTFVLGLEADVEGSKVSIQEINIQAKMGRTV